MPEEFMDKLLDSDTPFLNFIAIIVVGTCLLLGGAYLLVLLSEFAVWLPWIPVALFVRWSFKRVWNLYKS